MKLKFIRTLSVQFTLLREVSVFMRCPDVSVGLTILSLIDQSLNNSLGILFSYDIFMNMISLK